MLFREMKECFNSELNQTGVSFTFVSPFDSELFRFLLWGFIMLSSIMRAQRVGNSIDVRNRILLTLTIGNTIKQPISWSSRGYGHLSVAMVTTTRVLLTTLYSLIWSNLIRFISIMVKELCMEYSNKDYHWLFYLKYSLVYN